MHEVLPVGVGGRLHEILEDPRPKFDRPHFITLCLPLATDLKNDKVFLEVLRCLPRPLNHMSRSRQLDP